MDMWALGVLLFVLLTGSFPFKGLNETELYIKIQRGIFTIPEYVSKEARTILCNLLELNRKQRMTAAELIKDPWVKCSDLPLTVFESAGTIHRNRSVENKKGKVLMLDKENISDTHNRAIE